MARDVIEELIEVQLGHPEGVDLEELHELHDAREVGLFRSRPPVGDRAPRDADELRELSRTSDHAAPLGGRGCQQSATVAAG